MRGPKVRLTLLMSGLDISEEVNKRDDTTYTHTKLVYHYLGMASMVEGQRAESEGRVVLVFVSLCVRPYVNARSDSPVHRTCQISLSNGEKMRTSPVFRPPSGHCRCRSTATTKHYKSRPHVIGVKGTAASSCIVWHQAPHVRTLIAIHILIPISFTL